MVTSPVRQDFLSNSCSCFRLRCRITVSQCFPFVCLKVTLASELSSPEKQIGECQRASPWDGCLGTFNTCQCKLNWGLICEIGGLFQVSMKHQCLKSGLIPGLQLMWWVRRNGKHQRGYVQLPPTRWQNWLTVSPSACRSYQWQKSLWDFALGSTCGASVHLRGHYVPCWGRRSASQRARTLPRLLAGGVHHQWLLPFWPYYVYEEGRRAFTRGPDEGPPGGSLRPAASSLLDHGELPGLRRAAAETWPGVRERVPSQATDPPTSLQLLWPLQDLKHCGGWGGSVVHQQQNVNCSECPGQ